MNETNTPTTKTEEVLRGDVLTPEEMERLAKEERRKRSLANLRPLKKASECTPEELERQKEIVVKGGNARNLQLQERKNLKETTLALLTSKVSKEYAKRYIDNETIETFGDTITMQDILTARMFQEVLENGSSKAMEFLRDTSGQKPTTELEINADIVTAADRALLDKFKSNLVKMHQEKIG